MTVNWPFTNRALITDSTDTDVYWEIKLSPSNTLSVPQEDQHGGNSKPGQTLTLSPS